MKNFAQVFIVAVFLMIAGAPHAEAQVSVNVGVNLGVFPNLVAVPDYPVYYAPEVRGNYFFYDGLFWVFNVNDGYWYSSSWYNGPWVYVEPVYVPQPILVIPYRYYRVRPAYWDGWELERPPRWSIMWGGEWESRRRDWDHWDRRRYVIAPLPLFQREYVRARYPSPSQQVIIYKEKYTYKPVDVHVREVHTTVLERESHGGFKARDRAEFVTKGRREERVRTQENVHEDKGWHKGGNVEHESKGYGKGGNVEHEDKGYHKGNIAQENKGRHEEKGIREGKGGGGPQKGEYENQKGQYENKGRQKGY